MAEKVSEYIYMAKLSEQMERFEDMVEYMKKIIDLSRELKDEERNLLSIAYKNAVGQRRTAWRAIYAYEMKEKTKVLMANQTNLIKLLIKGLSSYGNHKILQIETRK